MRNPPTRSETDFSELTESELPGWLPRCDDPVEMDRLITIGTYTTRGEAELVEGLLESAGIAASIRADDAGGGAQSNREWHDHFSGAAGQMDHGTDRRD